MPLYISRVFCSHRALQPAVFSPLPAGFSQPILSALSPFQAESSQPFHLFFIWLKYLPTILHISLSAIYYLGEFHRVAGRSNNFLILRQDCCLWSRRVSSGRGQRQQNPASEACLLPLVTACFIGSWAEAETSCFRGAFAASGHGELHQVVGRSNKFLILRQNCCLWSRRVSSGRGQKQQILDFETTLLPLVTACFIGLWAEAANS